MSFEDGWCNGVWVAFNAFVEFGKGGCVTWGVGGVRGTRQGSDSSGGGDHDVEVYGGVGGQKRDVGPVEGGGVPVN